MPTANNIVLLVLVLTYFQRAVFQWLKLYVLINTYAFIISTSFKNLLVAIVYTFQGHDMLKSHLKIF